MNSLLTERGARHFRLAIVAALVAGLLLGSVASFAQSKPKALPTLGQTTTCLCGDFHDIELDPIPGSFNGIFNGSISAVTGASYVAEQGLETVPLQIKGYSVRSYVDGLGETMIWLDAGRRTDGSNLQENAPGMSFPATQTMSFHFLMTTEALPGVVLRSVNPATLVNESLDSFPPEPGATYHLAGVVELENVDDPGKVIGRVLNSEVRISSSRIE